MDKAEQELVTEIFRWQEKILQLPTPESQTIEWLIFERHMREERGAHRSVLRMWLECDGFSIYLQTKGWLRDANLVCLNLGRIEIAEQHQRKGWFKNYIKMCLAMMPHEGLILEQVINPDLYKWLAQQPSYERVDKCFLHRKSAVVI